MQPAAYDPGLSGTKETCPYWLSGRPGSRVGRNDRILSAWVRQVRASLFRHIHSLANRLRTPLAALED
jgi:hypothetical protein